LINRGINGQTSTQILIRFTADVLDLKPKCVVVLVGTNDIAENNGPISLEKIQHHFQTIVDVAKSKSCKVILCSILPVASYYWNSKIIPIPKIKALNHFLVSLANEESVVYVDFFTALEKDNAMNPLFSDDGVHPNAAGYEIMLHVLLQSHHDLLYL
jgi:alpha-L-fucosidase